MCNRSSTNYTNTNVGEDCSIPDSKGVWYNVEPSHLPLGRASHKSAVDEEYMYVLKGETFSRYYLKDCKVNILFPPMMKVYLKRRSLRH